MWDSYRHLICLLTASKQNFLNAVPDNKIFIFETPLAQGSKKKIRKKKLPSGQ